MDGPKQVRGLSARRFDFPQHRVGVAAGLAGLRHACVNLRVGSGQFRQHVDAVAGGRCGRSLLSGRGCWQKRQG